MYEVKMKVDVDGKFNLFILHSVKLLVEHRTSLLAHPKRTQPFKPLTCAVTEDPQSLRAPGSVHTSTCHPRRPFHQFVSVSIKLHTLVFSGLCFSVPDRSSECDGAHIINSDPPR